MMVSDILRLHDFIQIDDVKVTVPVYHVYICTRAWRDFQAIWLALTIQFSESEDSKMVWSEKRKYSPLSFEKKTGDLPSGIKNSQLNIETRTN